MGACFDSWEVNQEQQREDIGGIRTSIDGNMFWKCFSSIGRSSDNKNLFGPVSACIELRCSLSCAFEGVK